jgi:molybdenum cofactor synthesis domain-containing protein
MADTEPRARANPIAAMLVIGDEILSGRTRDSNMHHLAGCLTEAGIDLAEARMVPDDEARIVAALDALRTAHDHVFTSGGIGPTHDDITADAVGRAFGVPVAVRADARALLEAHYAPRGIELNEARLRMARVPEGAVLIDNPVSAAPGFRIGNVHVMAGVPKIFEAMLAGILPGLGGGRPLLSRSVPVDRGEGDIAAPLARAVAAFPDIAFGSYPYQTGEGRFGTNLVLRGPDADRLEAGEAALRDLLDGA